MMSLSKEVSHCNVILSSVTADFTLCCASCGQPVHYHSRSLIVILSPCLLSQEVSHSNDALSSVSLYCHHTVTRCNVIILSTVTAGDS